MRSGRIEQRGGPHDIYSRPANAFVSNFVGVANLVKGRVIAVDGAGRGEFEITQCGRRVQLSCRLGEGVGQGAEAILSVRPENVHAARENAGEPCLEGEVLQAIFLGNGIDCRVRWGEFEWKVLAHPRAHLKKGEKVYLRLDPEHTLAVLA
jgi:ABC-type Fe3+/spermidine/putrescine transport system ATPase subunit